MSGYTYRSEDGALALLSHELTAVGARQDEYAIFGSANLAIREIIDREIDDVDVFVSKRVWGLLLARDRWRWETPCAGDPPILTFPGSHPLHLFFEWHDQFVDMTASEVIARGEPIVGFSLASLEDVLMAKRQALSYNNEKVQKHVPDIAAIERYMEEHR
jgi:hypothetical protein